MKTIKNLSVTKTTHSELLEISNSYRDIVKNHLSDNQFLMSILDLIAPKLTNLKSALAAIRINSLVEEAFALDEARDNAFIVFRDMVKAFEKTDIEVEKEAYQLLWAVIEKVGARLYSEGYIEQSGRLATLFQELDKPENLIAMSTLGLTTRYEKLKTAEQNFKNIYSERLEEDTKKNYPTIKKSRTELTPLINDLIPTLRYVVRIADEECTDLSWVALMNEKTDLVMTQITARRTRKENEDTNI